MLNVVNAVFVQSTMKVAQVGLYCAAFDYLEKIEETTILIEIQMFDFDNLMEHHGAANKK